MPPSFFRHAAEGWARKVPGRTEDMIVPKLLDGVVDETGDDFVKNMDSAGVAAAFVMMVDAGAPSFGEYSDELMRAGFVDITIDPTHEEVDQMFGAIVRATKPAS